MTGVQTCALPILFAGMLGVTSFGLFLTPVFFVTIESWLARRKQHPDYTPLSATAPLSAGEETPRA